MPRKSVVDKKEEAKHLGKEKNNEGVGCPSPGIDKKKAKVKSPDSLTPREGQETLRMLSSP
jgi:hypothetical protein